MAAPNLYQHFLLEEIPSTCFMSFYMTIFCYKTPAKLAVQVFDLFFMKLEMAITDTLVNMLKFKEDFLLRLAKDEILIYLFNKLAKDCTKEISLNDLVK